MRCGAVWCDMLGSVLVAAYLSHAHCCCCCCCSPPAAGTVCACLRVCPLSLTVICSVRLRVVGVFAQSKQAVLPSLAAYGRVWRLVATVARYLLSRSQQRFLSPSDCRCTNPTSAAAAAHTASRSRVAPSTHCYAMLGPSLLLRPLHWHFAATQLPLVAALQLVQGKVQFLARAAAAF